MSHHSEQDNSIQLLQRQVAGLEKRGRIATLSSLVSLFGLILILFTSQTGATNEFRVRKLVIVDAKGSERIVIAAPIPDPMVNGKTRPRRNVVEAGIQFKDPNGTERGGLAATDDGAFIVGIDDEDGRERAHLYYLPKRGSGLFLQGNNNKETVSLLIPANGATPSLEMTDTTGERTMVLPGAR